MINVLLIMLGFIMLVVGADLLVKGSSNIAKKFKITERDINARVSNNNKLS